MENLTNKVILVTGASRGIGAVLASKLAEAGAQVIVNYASGSEAAAQVVNQITAAGGDAKSLQADVSDPYQVRNLFDQSIAYYGRIDVLINNAGIMIIKPIKDTLDEDFIRQFDINVKGVFNTLREAATKLADNGSIINFSTTNNRLMIPGYATYSASKSAVEQLTKVFSREVGSRGIRVNSISPGPTNTELFMKGKSQEAIDRLASLSPFNRIAQPEEIVDTILFLISDRAKWINAQNFGINGGAA